MCTNHYIIINLYTYSRQIHKSIHFRVRCVSNFLQMFWHYHILLHSILQNRGIDLSCVRTCTVVGEERPRVSLLTSFSALFSALSLPPHAVSASFGCRVSPMICLQGPQHPEPSTVYVDQRALRVDRLTVLERGAPNSLCLIESGKILPDVKVAIVHPDSKVPCAHTDLGEVWHVIFV